MVTKNNWGGTGASLIPYADTHRLVVTRMETPKWVLLEWILQNRVRHFVTHKQVQADKQHPI